MLRTSSLSLFVLALALPVTAQAQHCEVPRVLLTVDRSSSMLGDAGGMTKWDAATVAITDVTMAYEGRIDFGLQVFPYPDRCQPGEVMLDPGAHTATEIVEALGAPPPAAGNWTPMSQTLDAAGAYLGPSASGMHLVLVTDGWQWCSPYSAATRFDPVTSVMNLRAMGMTVHVVGFGAEVDALTLNRAAVAGGAPLAGCDPTLSDPAATGHCYAQVGDLTSLRSALEGIARSVTAEDCNGQDDDCDGLVDEGFDVDGDGVTSCAGDCDDATATTHEGAPESCNGVDDDCDGTIDPGCDCVDGDVVACGSSVGACRAGTSTCAGGAYGACESAVEAGAESCDGTDQDCDGSVDEDARCADGMACIRGACTPLVPEVPAEPVAPAGDDTRITDDGGTDGEDPYPARGGCGCSTQGPAPLPAGLVLMGLALVVASRRRR